MSPYFYSLGMLISGAWREAGGFGAMDLLADAIADEEKPPHPWVEQIFLKDGQQ